MRYIVAIIIIIISLSECSDTAPSKKLFSFFYPSIYIKTIDQDGFPVEGVNFVITHGGNGLFSNMGFANFISDKNGLIKIRHDKRQVSFSRAYKNNYTINMPVILDQYDKTRTYPVPVQGDFFDPDLIKFREESPFIIQAWRIDTAQIETKCIYHHAAAIIEPDNSIYGINLMNTESYKINKGVENSDLTIQFNRESIDDIKDTMRIERKIVKKNWRFSINVKNGGLIEIDPNVIYRNTPPESGYSPNLTFNNMSLNKSEVNRTEFIRHYYMKVNDKFYARLEIEYRPAGSYRDENKTGLIEVSYSLNIDNLRYVRSENKTSDGYKGRLPEPRVDACYD